MSNPFKKPRTRRVAIATVAVAGIAAVSVPTYQALATDQASTVCDVEFLPNGENVMVEGSDPTGSYIFGYTIDEDNMRSELWKDGELLDIRLPDDTFINAVNSSGTTVGYTQVDDDTQTPIHYDGEDVRELALPEDADGGSTMGISDDGLIAGYAEIGGDYIGVTWDENGELQELPVPEGMESASPDDIDSEGNISGSAIDPYGVSHPFVWRDGEATELAGLTDDEDAGSGAFAWAIAGDWAIGDHRDTRTEFIWNGDADPVSIKDPNFGLLDVNSSGLSVAELQEGSENPGGFLVSSEGEATEITGPDGEAVAPASITEDGQVIGGAESDGQRTATVFNCG